MSVVSLAHCQVVFHYLSNMPLDNLLLYGVHARFWQQPHLISSVAVGVGLHRAACIADDWARALSRGGGGAVPATAASTRPVAAAAAAASAPRGSDALALVGAAVVAVAAAGALIAGGLRVNDHSATRYLESYARAILGAVPEGAIVMLSWDQQWTVARYLQTCEGFRWVLRRAFIRPSASASAGLCAAGPTSRC